MPDMAPLLDLEFILNPEPAPRSALRSAPQAVPRSPPALPPAAALFPSLPSARYAAPPTIDVVPSALRRKRDLPGSFPAPLGGFCVGFEGLKRARASPSPSPSPSPAAVPAPLPSLFARGWSSFPSAQPLGYGPTLSPASSVADSACMATSSEGEASADEDHELEPEDASLGRKKTRLCKVKGCTSLAVSRRSCVRHGGGSRCVVEGCTNGAKLRNRCFQHGGSTVCLAAGCASKAKRYGYCWSHGGGRICSAAGCAKVAAQGGLCWAHGGGNRCRLDGCSKRSYQKHGYYCKAHAAYNTSS